MTDPNVPCDEPELPELGQLRELSRMEAAPDRMREQILARAQATLSSGAARRTPVTRQRSILLAALVLIGVPSAFAATPLGQRHLGAWFGSELPGPVPRRLPPTTVAETQQKRVSMVEVAAPAPHQPEVDLPSTGVVTSSKPAGRAHAYRGRHVGEPLTAAAAESRTPVRAFPLAAEGAIATPPDRQEAATSLDAESRLLRQARLRLAARDADGALRLAEEHRRRFPSGLLRQERLGIEQQAWALHSGSGSR